MTCHGLQGWRPLSTHTHTHARTHTFSFNSSIFVRRPQQPLDNGDRKWSQRDVTHTISGRHGRSFGSHESLLHVSSSLWLKCQRRQVYTRWFQKQSPPIYTAVVGLENPAGESHGYGCGMAFCVTGPVAWINLPLDIRSAPTLSTFKNMLKTHHFFSHVPTSLTNCFQSTSSEHCTAPFVVTLAIFCAT